jgi:hypothetical protein
MLKPRSKMNAVLRRLCRFSSPLILGKGVKHWARQSVIWLFRHLLKGQTHHVFSHGVSLHLSAYGHTVQIIPVAKAKTLPAPTLATWSLPPAPLPTTHAVRWEDCLHRVLKPMLEFQRASYAFALGFRVTVPDWATTGWKTLTHSLSARPHTETHPLCLALATVSPAPPPVHVASPHLHAVACALPAQTGHNGQAAIWAQPIRLKPVMADMLSQPERRHLEGFFDGPVRIVKLFAPLWTGLYARLKLGGQGELLAWPGPDVAQDATPDCLILATCQRTGTWQRVVIKESERDRG